MTCTLGVGCDEAGICYADAHGQPEQCGRRETDLAAQERAKIVFFLHRTIRRSIPTMDATWSAAFNAAIDYCADAIERGDHHAKATGAVC